MIDFGPFWKLFCRHSFTTYKGSDMAEPFTDKMTEEEKRRILVHEYWVCEFCGRHIRKTVPYSRSMLARPKEGLETAVSHGGVGR